MAGVVMRVVIEPPDDHERHELVSGERLEATIVLEDHSPWHKPWEGWKITEVMSEHVIEDREEALAQGIAAYRSRGNR